MKRKKSLLVMGALVRILITLAVIFLVVIPACNKIRAAFYNPDKKYLESFEDFVNQINEMEPNGARQFSLETNKKSAIIGFRKDSGHWECFNCNIGKQNRPSAIVEKPPECTGKACICLCNGAYNLRSGDWNGKSASFGECGNNFLCKELKPSFDVVPKTIVEKHPWGTEDWNNGFLFANGMPGTSLVLNGLKHYDEDLTKFFVQISSNEMGICIEDMLEHNQDELGLPPGTCINKDWS